MFGTGMKTESETGTILIGLISMQAVNKLSSNVFQQVIRDIQYRDE